MAKEYLTKGSGSLEGASTASLDDLSDVALGTPSDEQVLTYVDGAGNWQAVTSDKYTQGEVDAFLANYTLVDGTRAFTGNIDLGTNAITNVGNVDGKDVSTLIANVSEDTTPQLGGDLDVNGSDILCSDNIVSRPELTDYAITHNSVGSSSGSITYDVSTGNSFATTLTENITSMTLSNPSTSGTLCEITIQFTQGAGSYTVAFPASVKFPGGTAPTITTTASAIDLVTLRTIDGGTTWLGNFSQDYS